MDHDKLVAAVRMLLEAIGENPERDGLKETPRRVAAMYEEIFAGIGADPVDTLRVLPAEQHDEIVLVKDIPFYSICEHHLMPFLGKAHVAYIPQAGRVTGISKLARAVEIVSKRPQVQERLTTEVADSIMKALNPRGVMVVIEAEHLCMTMRGVRKPGSKTVTSAVRGIFRTNFATRSEAMALINGQGV
ncbi:MAG TPA: GTP cyclohydrolase I FolE [Candidatus Brocadiia bacterium]|nr:GTP cyclohydrolase I FolE [Candidatus Brocadiia bacterium]